MTFGSLRLHSLRILQCNLYWLLALVFQICALVVMKSVSQSESSIFLFKDLECTKITNVVDRKPKISLFGKIKTRNIFAQKLQTFRYDNAFFLAAMFCSCGERIQIFTSQTKKTPSDRGTIAAFLAQGHNTGSLAGAQTLDLYPEALYHRVTRPYPSFLMDSQTVLLSLNF